VLKKCRLSKPGCHLNVDCLGKLVRSLYCIKCASHDKICLSSHAKQLCAEEQSLKMVTQKPAATITLAPTAAPTTRHNSVAPTAAPSLMPTQYPTSSPTPTSLLEIRGAISLEGWAQASWSPTDAKRVSAALAKTVGVDTNQVAVAAVRQTMNDYWGGLLLQYGLYIPKAFCDEQGKSHSAPRIRDAIHDIYVDWVF
jgi:hypothetical protein